MSNRIKTFDAKKLVNRNIGTSKGINLSNDFLNLQNSMEYDSHKYFNSLNNNSFGESLNKTENTNPFLNQLKVSQNTNPFVNNYFNQLTEKVEKVENVKQFIPLNLSFSDINNDIFLIYPFTGKEKKVTIIYSSDCKFNVRFSKFPLNDSTLTKEYVNYFSDTNMTDTNEQLYKKVDININEDLTNYDVIMYLNSENNEENNNFKCKIYSVIIE